MASDGVAAMAHLGVFEQLRNKESLDGLVEDAIVWATAHGLVMVPAKAQPASAVCHAPIALTPVPYPRDTFMRAKSAAEDFSLLMDAVARDEEYLVRTLSPVAKHDDFVVRGLTLEGVLEVGEWVVVDFVYNNKVELCVLST